MSKINAVQPGITRSRSSKHPYKFLVLLINIIHLRMFKNRKMGQLPRKRLYRFFSAQNDQTHNSNNQSLGASITDHNVNWDRQLSEQLMVYPKHSNHKRDRKRHTVLKINDIRPGRNISFVFITVWGLTIHWYTDWKKGTRDK